MLQEKLKSGGSLKSHGLTSTQREHRQSKKLVFSLISIYLWILQNEFISIWKTVCRVYNKLLWVKGSGCVTWKSKSKKHWNCVGRPI